MPLVTTRRTVQTLSLCYFGLREPLVQTPVLPSLRQISNDEIDVSAERGVAAVDTCQIRLDHVHRRDLPGRDQPGGLGGREKREIVAGQLTPPRGRWLLGDRFMQGSKVW